CRAAYGDDGDRDGGFRELLEPGLARGARARDGPRRLPVQRLPEGGLAADARDVRDRDARAPHFLAADRAPFVLSLFRERGLEAREHSRAMRADAAVPVLLAERGRAGELVDGIELQPRARVARLEPPSELELDPARRSEQCLLQRDRDRPDAFDDPSAPQHRAALLLVARSGRQHPSARTQQAL